MHFKDVLEKHGCTPKRLRDIFTTQPSPETPAQVSMDRIEPPKTPMTDADICGRIQSMLRARIIEGIGNNGRNARPFQAVDMAADAPPVQRETIPLLMWAQGKIKIKTCYDKLCSTVGTQAANQFFKKADDGSIAALDVARITDISIDLVKSYVTRRHAAMDGLRCELWPLWKYDPRGTDDVSLFRADVLTQRVDIMSEDYNYRHLSSQLNRQMLLYNFSCAFPRSSWDKKIGWRFERTNTGEIGEKTESYVEREGLDFVKPHPARIIYDPAYPFANINTDTGPRWVGYWDVVRFGEMLSADTDYYNLDRVYVSSQWIDLANKYSEFFGYYMDPTILGWPDPTSTGDPSASNSRESRVGRYTSEMSDQGCLLTNMFVKINPKRWNIGEYDNDVWLRCSVAGDCTVVAAEFMPSIPCAYGAVNVNDDRYANQSMAMALLSYQDQASNIISHMLQQIRASLIQLMLLDKDSLDADLVKEIKDNAQNKNWWVDMKVLTYSSSALKDNGFSDPRTAFVIVQNQITNAVDAGLKALGQLLNLADRLLILSPNELGQPNPREVSAREVDEVSTSVQAMTSFVNSGPREQTAAMKRMVYESYICFGSEMVRVPVEKRYTREIIKKAGFSIPPDVHIPADEEVPSQTPVMGNLHNLNYDYYFSSREGAERQVNSQGAQNVINLLGFLFKLPGIPQALGVRGTLDAANLVIRMSGAPWNFQFNVPVGSSDKMPEDPSVAGDAQMKQVMAMVQQLGSGVMKIEQVLMHLLHVPASVFGIQPGPPGPGQPGPHPAPHPAAAGAPPPHGAPPQPAPAPAPAPPGGAPPAAAGPPGPGGGGPPSPAETLAEPAAA